MAAFAPSPRLRRTVAFSGGRLGGSALVPALVAVQGATAAAQAPLPPVSAAPGQIPIRPRTAGRCPEPSRGRLRSAGSGSRHTAPGRLGPHLLRHMLCFEKQGGSPVIDAQTYVYYIQARPSNSRENRWIAYDEALEETLLGDFASVGDEFPRRPRRGRGTSGIRMASWASWPSSIWKSASAKIVDYVGSRVSHPTSTTNSRKKGSPSGSIRSSILESSGRLPEWA